MRKFATLLLIVICLLLATRQTKATDYERILFMGDSFTQGLYSTSYDKGYAHLVADDLGAVYYISYSGGIDGLVQNWEKHKGFDPDLVIIEIGLNDVHNEYPLAQWTSQYTLLLDNIQADSDARIIALTMPNAPPPESPVISDYPLFNQAITSRTYNRGLNVSVVDIWSQTTDPGYKAQHYHRSAFPPAFSGDNFHFNDLGHRVMADLVIEEINREVEDRFLPYMKTSTDSPYP